MIELKSAPASEEAQEMVDLFAIDDVTYQVPAKPRVNVALQYLTDARKHGEGMAQMMLLEKLLGAEGYKALSEYDELTSDQLSQVSDFASNLTLGALETDSGNDDSGSGKSPGS